MFLVYILNEKKLQLTLKIIIIIIFSSNNTATGTNNNQNRNKMFSLFRNVAIFIFCIIQKFKENLSYKRRRRGLEMFFQVLSLDNWPPDYHWQVISQLEASYWTLSLHKGHTCCPQGVKIVLLKGRYFFLVR